MSDGPQIKSAAVYARSGAGSPTQIEHQVKACRELAHARGWTVGEVYSDDGYSGMGADRPGYQRMVEDIQAGLRDAVIADRAESVFRDRAEPDRFLNMCDTACTRFVEVVENPTTRLRPKGW